MRPGRVRDEYEYAIPEADATAMLAAFVGDPLIDKVRHRVPVGGHVFEVDEFEGANRGLVIAEIELDAPDEDFPHPPWLGDEVTDDGRYYNFRLVSEPFGAWPEELKQAVVRGRGRPEGAAMTLGPVMVDLQGVALEPDERELLAHPQVGSVILFTRNYENPEQLQRLVAEIHAIRTPALLVAVDHEGGRVQRFQAGFTRLPPMREVGRRYGASPADGLALARQLGWLMAVELRAVGVDLSFAPCVDIDYGVSRAIGDRALHADAAVVGELAVAYMLGMREAGMAATAKHFPGHGAVAADSHVALPVDRREWPDIEADLRPYRRMIANGLPAVMAAHVVFPEVDDKPASLSRRWISDILRGELGFQGAIFADDLSMAGAAAFGGIATRAELALAAGCDVLPVCNDRAATLELLDKLRLPADPVSRMRLARLHGRDGAGQALGRRSALAGRSRGRARSVRPAGAAA